MPIFDACHLRVTAFLLLIALALVSAPESALAQSIALEASDISILMPLPESPGKDQLMRPETPGKYGELLPRTLYDGLPPLVFAEQDENFRQLRAVAVRLDPCFPLTLSSGCEPQIRIVWQPVIADGHGGTRTLDAAVHSFYSLSEGDFKELIRKLVRLRSEADLMIARPNHEALGVHPVLKREGLGGAYGTRLFQLLLGDLGARRLSRLTFMQLTGSGNIWTFGAFIVSDHKLRELPIPRVNEVQQTFSNNPIIPSYYAHGSMRPAPKGEDTLNLLVYDSRSITNADEKAVIEATLSATRIENPKLHSPLSMDCVSCHVAQAARIWATRQYPWLMLEQRAEQFRFQSFFNLANLSAHPERTTVLRGFGYDSAEPAISQRVINETALVLEQLQGY